MAVGPFSVTETNIEQQQYVVQIAKNVTHNIQMFNSCQSKLYYYVMFSSASEC